mmetsp:Transcript_2255/g.3547  ORF Transcript_2255/g.3547 Transcript_2255/m.3547 type:complete len:241 (-) Transcript_2255:125-847(-)
MGEVLVLGGESAGKTLFIRRLSEYEQQKGTTAKGSANPSEACMPTVGVDLTTIEFRRHTSSAVGGGSGSIATSTYDMREIGSALSSRWESYLPDSHQIIFLIDSSDTGTLVSSLVLLHEMLYSITQTEKSKQHGQSSGDIRSAISHTGTGADSQENTKKSILVALNKTDLVTHKSLLASMNFLDFDGLKAMSLDYCNIDVIAGSCMVDDLKLNTHNSLYVQARNWILNFSNEQENKAILS